VKIKGSDSKKNSSKNDPDGRDSCSSIEPPEKKPKTDNKDKGGDETSNKIWHENFGIRLTGKEFSKAIS